MAPNGPPPIDGTLFHFTRTFGSLIGILEHDFKPHYSLEDLRVTAHGGGIIEDKWAVPMTCFCDLRLSQIREHLRDYGDYGIGLTKEWGVRNGLSPVIYLHRRSYSSELIWRTIEHLRKIHETEHSGDLDDSDALAAAIDLVAMTKQYEGPWLKNGKSRRKRFYDEREWRYLPHLIRMDGSPDRPRILSAEQFQDNDLRMREDEAIATLCPLPFSPWDIVYLFVKDDQEIIPLVEEIGRIKIRYAVPEVTLLTTRILSTDRIPRDF